MSFGDSEFFGFADEAEMECDPAMRGSMHLFREYSGEPQVRVDSGNGDIVIGEEFTGRIILPVDKEPSGKIGKLGGPAVAEGQIAWLLKFRPLDYMDLLAERGGIAGTPPMPSPRATRKRPRRLWRRRTGRWALSSPAETSCSKTYCCVLRGREGPSKS